MGSSLWDQVWLPLLIGVAIQIIVAALWFLSVQLGKCLQLIKTTQTAAASSAGDGAQVHALPEVSSATATADANAVIDLVTGNSFASTEGRGSIAQLDLQMTTENGGDEGPKAQVTTSATRGALVPAEVDVPQQEKVDE